MGILDAPAVAALRSELACTMPSAFATAWGATYPLTAYLTGADRLGRKRGRVSLDLLAAFNAKTTAYTAPTNTYYVSIDTGNDTTGTGASATPWKSIWKAIEAANTSAQPAKIYIVASTTSDYNRNFGFAFASDGGSALVPTVDIAFIIRGGCARVGTYLGNGIQGTTAYTFAFDATLTNCQANTTGTLNSPALDKISDRINLSAHGRDTELLQVSTTAIANVTPNSWAYDGAGKVFINRADRRAVTPATTRLFPTVHALRMTQPKNIAILPETDGDSLILEGGSTGTFNAVFSTPSGTDKVGYFKAVTFRTPGGIVNTGDQRAVSIDSWNGLVAFENCSFEDGRTDGLNARNAFAATAVRVLSLNCTGRGNGRYGNTSCNGHTGHDGVLMVDVAGWYDRNNGGTMAYVNTVKAWLVGSYVTEDYGDVHLNGGGTFGPTGLYARDTAEIWADQCELLTGSGTDAVSTKTSTAKIHLRNCIAQGGQGGLGTVDSY